MPACANGTQWANPDDDGGSSVNDYDSGTGGYDTGTRPYWDSGYQGGYDSALPDTGGPDTWTGGADAEPWTDSAAPRDSGAPLDSSSPRDSGVDSSSITDSASQDSPIGTAPTGLSVQYQVMDPAASSAYIGATLSILNSSSTSVTVSGLSLRYYYTDDVHMTPQMTINWSHISTSGANTDLSVSDSFAALTPSATGADSYIEFTFSSGHGALATGESAVFSWQMQGPNPAQDVYTQSNDYSFDASKTSLTNWDHVVLLQGGSVLWGVVP
jgi:mannan endo-1,4-beta-mannosidase